jgi:hypothetical protein
MFEHLVGRGVAVHRDAVGDVEVPHDVGVPLDHDEGQPQG